MVELNKIYAELKEKEENGEGYFIYRAYEYSDEDFENGTENVKVERKDDENRIHVYGQPVPGEKLENCLIITMGTD